MRERKPQTMNVSFVNLCLMSHSYPSLRGHRRIDVLFHRKLIITLVSTCNSTSLFFLVAKKCDVPLKLQLLADPAPQQNGGSSALCVPHLHPPLLKHYNTARIPRPTPHGQGCQMSLGPWRICCSHALSSSRERQGVAVEFRNYPL